VSERFAVFDVDHTVTRASTGRRLIQRGWAAGLFSISNVLMLPYLYLRYRTGTMQIDRVAARIGALSDVAQTRLESVAHECFNRDIRADIMPGALDLIRSHRETGDTIVLATSSLGLIVRPLASELEIEEVICTELEFADGVATGRFAGPPCYGEEKLRRVAEFVTARGGSLGDVTFYSDSGADLPLLEACGSPVAVNPDLHLRRFARRSGWPVVTIA
jgi:putative phosphoserine phosphatase/1-acylglycerol-3-phosphate O-acyltransferase